MLNDIKDILSQLGQDLIDKRHEIEEKAGANNHATNVLTLKIKHIDACIKHLKSMSCGHNYKPIGLVLNVKEPKGVTGDYRTILTQRLYCTKCAETTDIKVSL